MTKANAEPGSIPLQNPRHEIYAVERAAGLCEQDAEFVAGTAWVIPMEPGESVSPTRTRVQKQTLRRVDARLKVLAELERGLNGVQDREFLLRNARVRAELSWFKLVVECSGIEPEFDEAGRFIAPPKRKQSATPTNGGVPT